MEDPAGSASGARNRPWGWSSRAPVRSINTGPFSGFTFKVRRLEACEPVRNATRAASRLSAARGIITTGSSSSSPSVADPSAAAEISSTRGAGFDSLNNSRTSRASKLSPPITATSGRSVKYSSANLMLRFPRRRGTNPPAHDATRPNQDSASHVADGHSQQHWLGKIPDQVDQTSDQDE